MQMISNILLNRWIAPVLALTATSSLIAGTIPVKGPANPGHARPPLHINLAAASASYRPSQIRHAYGFDQLTPTGANQKIAIVNAYGNKSIQSDLNTFCS